MKLFTRHLPALLGGTLVALACAGQAAFASTAIPIINGFNAPGGFTLNGNTGGPDGQDATAHGVPKIIGGTTLHLTTAKGVVDHHYNTFFGSENTSAFYNSPQYIGQFYASFTYRYNGTNPQSFGPGNGFTFILQNDPRGLNALGTTGYGNGQQGDSGTIAPSAAVEFGLFTGFGQARGTQLAYDGDPGTGGTFIVPGNVNLISGDPISVILSYNGSTLSETLTDTVTGATFNTAYAADLPAAVGGNTAYVGFTGGTGAAVADQTISNFIFSNSVPTQPANTGPKIAVTASVQYVNQLNNGYEQVDVLVITTNSGGTYADQLQLTSVTLNGGAPSGGVPTTPNLLPAPGYQSNQFLFTVPVGTYTNAALRVGGQYIDPQTNGTGHFTGAVHLSF